MKEEAAKSDDALRRERRELYAQVCLKYQDGQHAAIQELDRAILTLSAGLLGLSLAFIKDVAPLHQAVWLPVLFWSWGLFGLAVGATLTSFFLSQSAFKQMQTNAYDYYIEEKESALLRKGWQSSATRYLTYAEAISFIIALILTLAFVIRNVEYAHATIGLGEGERIGQMNKLSSPNGPSREQKGVEPAGMIRVPKSQPQPSSDAQAPQPQEGPHVNQPSAPPPNEAQSRSK